MQYKMQYIAAAIYYSKFLLNIASRRNGPGLRLPVWKADSRIKMPCAARYPIDNVSVHFTLRFPPSCPALATPTASALLPSPLPPPSLRFPSRHVAAPGIRRLAQPLRAGRPRLQAPPPAPAPAEEVAEEPDVTPPLRLLEPPQVDDPFPPEVPVSLSNSWNFLLLGV